HSLPFRVKLPHGPISYRGELLHVDWYVRATVDVAWAIDPKTEQIINVGPPQSIAPYVHGPGKPDLGFESNQQNRLTQTLISAALILWILVYGGFMVYSGLNKEGNFRQGHPIYVIIPLIILYTMWQRSIASQRLGGVQIQVSQTQLHAGDPFTVKVDVTPK